MYLEKPRGKLSEALETSSHSDRPELNYLDGLYAAATQRVKGPQGIPPLAST